MHAVEKMFLAASAASAMMVYVVLHGNP